MRSDSLVEYAAWRRAMVQYNQQRGEQADATTLANTSAEIPFGESVLTTKTTPPPGAPNPDDPIAQERVRENTERLADSGVATKLCIDRTLEASLFERTETS
ncbi:hypothetical protein VN97_g3580 [Penicillium thymicola]|uniref:Uncharacterized protein n=1 Tax=Penicillium thymicola TaxID=293382 RepID=A0AAI9XAP9_PENTH|nr:hypothetical protein VN97_g3580 [Penicillium thymicola]